MRGKATKAPMDKAGVNGVPYYPEAFQYPTRLRRVLVQNAAPFYFTGKKLSLFLPNKNSLRPAFSSTHLVLLNTLSAQSVFRHVHAAAKNDLNCSPPAGGEFCEAFDRADRVVRPYGCFTGRCLQWRATRGPPYEPIAVALLPLDSASPRRRDSWRCIRPGRRLHRRRHRHTRSCWRRHSVRRRHRTRRR